MFQFICRKNTYDWIDIEKLDLQTNELKVERLGSLCRAFAYNNKNVKWTIYKHKPSNRAPKSTLQNVPDNVFVHNNEILSDKTVDKLMQDIDYDYYINRSYQRIQEFFNLKQVKKLV